MRVVLLGDSHLARIRRDLPRLGCDIVNRAAGGALALHLQDQAVEARIMTNDVVVVSIGTNDAAPMRQVPLAEFLEALSRVGEHLPARALVYVTPPGVDETRLVGPRERTNAVIDDYRNAAVSLCLELGAQVVRAERTIQSLGRGAFVSDGLHLSGRAYRLLLPAIAEAVQANA